MAATFITQADAYTVTPSSPVLAKIIHYVGLQAVDIAGVTTVYDYGNNPLDVPEGHLPALIFMAGTIMPRRYGGGEMWRKVYSVEAWLLAALWDRSTRNATPLFVEPAAMEFGELFEEHFNSGATAHARRVTLCQQISCEDLVMGDALYAGDDYGSRGYIMWKMSFSGEVKVHR